jgi:hypothetical protein
MVPVTRGRGNRFAHLEDVNDREESVRKELPATYQAHSEAQFASLREQIAALTKLLSIRSGRDRRRHIYPHRTNRRRKTHVWRMKTETLLRSTERGVHRRQPLVQVQANRWESGLNLIYRNSKVAFNLKSSL